MAHPASLLLVSRKPAGWLSWLDESGYDVYIADDTEDATVTLNNILQDLVVVDAGYSAPETDALINTVSRRNPETPIVLVENLDDNTYRIRLSNKSSVSVLLEHATMYELRDRLWQLFEDYERMRSLTDWKKQLDKVTRVSRMLLRETDPHTLLENAAKLCVRTLDLYGVVILIEAGDKYQVYVASGDTAKQDVYRQVYMASQHDPFLWTINSGLIQVYKDISDNPHYTPNLLLGRARSVVIFPFSEGHKGAIGFFMPTHTEYSRDEMLVYEPFVQQLSATLHVTHQQEAREVETRSRELLLKSVNALSQLDSAKDIGQTLCEEIGRIPAVDDVYVWLSVDESGWMQNYIFSQRSPDPDQSMIDVIVELINDETAAPTTQIYIREVAQNKFAKTILKAMETQQIVAIPIVDSTRLVGGIVVGVNDELPFRTEYTRLIEAVSASAGQVLERITLARAAWETNNILQMVLDTVSEGIFLVDRADNVFLSTRQLSDLIGIDTRPFVGQSVDLLLSRIASVSTAPAGVLDQLMRAKASLATITGYGSDYPIVEFGLTKRKEKLFVELLRVENLSNDHVNWIGVIRVAAGAKSTDPVTNPLIKVMAEVISQPSAQMQSLAITLSNRHGHYNYRERDVLLSQMVDKVESVNRLWSTFFDIYSFQTQGMALHRGLSNIREVVERVLLRRSFIQYHAQFRVHADEHLPFCFVDEFRIERALTNVLQHALTTAPENSPTDIRISADRNVVKITIENQGKPFEERAFDSMFDALDTGLDLEQITYAFNLYLARQFIRAHSGELRSQATTNGARFMISLPCLDAALPASSSHVDDDMDMIASPATAPHTELLPAANGAPSRSPRNVLLIQGQSSLAHTLRTKLETQGYDLLVSTDPMDALKDMQSILLDLVIIDVSLREGLDACERIRKHSEVPIILIADNAEDSGKVQGLNAGADDFITKPISTDELMARINAILKRQYIPERTREPLQIGELRVDFARRAVFLKDTPVELTRVQYDLFHVLLENRGRVMTHQQLLEKVWGPEYKNDTHYLWVNISRLRKKLEPTPNSPRFIHNHPGIGYVFDIPD